MPQHYDLVIVGSGFVGLTLAHLLDKLSLKVLIIEQNSLAQMFDPTLDNRGIALSQASCKLLQEIEVADDLFEPESEIKQIQVGVNGLFGMVKLASADLLGYVVESTKLGRALLREFKHVEVKEQVQLVDLAYQVTTQLWGFNLKGQSYTCDLLIGADGVNSVVRKTLQIDLNQIFTDKLAVICNVEIADEHHGIAWQRFIDDKILALLPFGRRRMKCIVTIDSAVRASLELADGDYLILLQKFIGTRVKLLSVTPRLYYRSPQSRAQKITAPNSILLGNAANALSPVAAQGLNLGLRDVRVLSALLAKNGVNDVPKLLADYVRLRASDHFTTANFTKYIHKLMSDNPWRQSKSLLLTILELSPWLKRSLIKQTERTQ